MGLSVDDANLIVNQLLTSFKASLLVGNTNPPFEVKVVTIALDTAQDITNPYKVGPFRSVYVSDATDASVIIRLRPNVTDSYQGDVALSKKDVFALDNPVSVAYLTWTAQAGKTITLEFHQTSDFRPGNFLVTSTSAVEGTSASSLAKGTVTTAAAILLAVNSNRKATTIQNQGSASIYIGSSAVTVPSGANPGIEIPAGGSMTWKNPAALYAISIVGSQSVAILEET